MGLYTSISHELDLHAIDYFLANLSLRGEDIRHGGFRVQIHYQLGCKYTISFCHHREVKTINIQNYQLRS